MKGPAETPALGRAALARGILYLGFWALLTWPGTTDWGTDALLDLAVGLLAAVAATWLSLRLLPPSPGRLRLGALARFALHFLWQSSVAGVDVARRALAPRPRLKPGYVPYPVRFPPGPGQAAFGAITSLMPGTLPVGSDAAGALVYHGLDLDQPIAAGLARDEALLTRVRQGADSHD
jgi:multicomponent Na+:H+ antiporter subunit E